MRSDLREPDDARRDEVDFEPSSDGTVVRMIVQQGMGIALAGLVLGLAAAVALARVMTSLLYEVTPTDPATFGVVIGVLAAVSVVAAGIPALRAARVDPIIALRQD